MRKVIHGNKARTLASKSIKIKKTLGKIVIDNNQKVTWIFFYYQLSKLHQSEAKTLNRANFLTLSYCYGEMDEISSAPSHFLVFTGVTQSGDIAWLVI